MSYSVFKLLDHLQYKPKKSIFSYFHLVLKALYEVCVGSEMGFPALYTWHVTNMSEQSGLYAPEYRNMGSLRRSLKPGRSLTPSSVPL